VPAAAERLEFAPPPQPGLVRAFVLAILAHLLLMLALTWGINWNREAQNVAAEAELWSSIPQQAAPPEVQPPPAPPAVTQPPPPQVAPPPAPREADIAVEREKLQRQEEARKQAEAERQKKLEARKKRDELEREKKLEARKKEEALKKQQLAEQKAAEEKLKRKKEELAKKARQDEEKLAAIRKENLDRIKGMAGATGAPTSTGNVARSSGPSESYAGRIRARVRPNIVFTDDVPGNPMAEVEVRMAPDGTITSRRLVKSSGQRSWDEAVLRALDRTETLPRDVDGRVHSPLLIEFRPKG
jgi:colicin import membrane protein